MENFQAPSMQPKLLHLVKQEHSSSSNIYNLENEVWKWTNPSQKNICSKLAIVSTEIFSRLLNNKINAESV
jgi:hypothetical protein